MTPSWSPPSSLPACPALVQCLPGDVAGEGVVAGHAVGLPREGWPPPPAPCQGTETDQGGQEDLAEVGRDKVVEDGVDGGADVEEGVGQHVEVVVEVIEEPGGRGRSGRWARHTGWPWPMWGYFIITSRTLVSLERLFCTHSCPAPVS